MFLSLGQIVTSVTRSYILSLWSPFVL